MIPRIRSHSSGEYERPDEGIVRTGALIAAIANQENHTER